MSALLFIADGGFGHGHMGGWGWGAGAVMTMIMDGMGWLMWSTMRGTGGNEGGSPDDPVDVLAGRYASGEVSTEEFEERRRTIEAARH